MLDGFVDVVSREKVEGWLTVRGDLEQKPTLAILVDGHEVGRCRADLPHGKPKAPVEGAERCGFLFEFKPPLTIFRAHAIEVRHADTGTPVRNGAKTCPCPVNGRMPLAPILITSRGRAGTTLLMKEFVDHPDIVAADIYPYEVKLANYYASAYKVLVSHKTPPADDRGMDYVEMARRLMTVGGNPFNNPGRHKLASGDAIADIFEQDFPNQLSFLFRDTIARYYRALAHTYRKTGAHFFAEKSDIDADTRIGVRMLLGELREIVMIRDPRDFMCSAKAFWKMTPEQALETVAYTTRRMEEIAAEQAPDTLFVRYEDLIQDPVATRQAIGRFVGIEPPAGADARGDAKAGAALLGIHATSASPERSIGRWASDLDAAEIAACNARFASFMARFGYGAAAPAPKPAQAASVQAASVQPLLLSRLLLSRLGRRPPPPRRRLPRCRLPRSRRRSRRTTSPARPAPPAGRRPRRKRRRSPSPSAAPATPAATRTPAGPTASTATPGPTPARASCSCRGRAGRARTSCACTWRRSWPPAGSPRSAWRSPSTASRSARSASAVPRCWSAGSTGRCWRAPTRSGSRSRCPTRHGRPR